MEPKKSLSNINSAYIIKNIFTYIKDNNFKLKLFTFSKKFQNKLNIGIFHYQEIYFNKYNLNLNEYLNLRSFDLDKRSLLKDMLNEKLTKEKIDIHLFKSYVINYFKYKSKEEIKKDENLKFNSKLLIDISSPILEILSSTDILAQYFTISIPINYFITYSNLKEDYISCFDKLNKTKSKYSSIKIDFKNNEDINIIKELNINFEQIKELSILKNGRSDTYNYNYFFNNLFTMKSFINNINLEFLFINIFDSYNSIKIDANSLEGLNNFNNLKILKLNSFKINDIFTLKLSNLKELELNRCENIIFGEQLNLINLTLVDCDFPSLNSNSLILLPEVENCELLLNNINYIKYYKIFDFSKFHKVKNIKCEGSDFIHLSNNSLLEKAELLSKKKSTKEIEEKIINKIINMEKLREISFKLSNINLNEIPKEKNISIRKIKLFLEYNKNIDYNLYDLLDMFTNLQEIEVFTPKNNQKNKIKIIKNSNSKIEKITIEGSNKNNIELYCAPFENLKSVILNNIAGSFIDLKDTLPIFNNKCKVIFKSLNYFKFYSGEMNFNDFENLYKNLDKLPNLKSFCFDCIVNDISKKYYENFIKKLLSMKLDVIDLTMRIFSEENDEQEEQEENEDDDFDHKFNYSEKELKEIYPAMELNKNYNISKIINSAYM